MTKKDKMLLTYGVIVIAGIAVVAVIFNSGII